MPHPVNNDPDTKLIIFQNTRELYAMLEDATQEAHFTDKLKIGSAGNTGDFYVVNQQSKRTFHYGYQSQIWSVSDTDLVSTKIVEVAP